MTDDLAREIAKQDTLHPSGYPYTRDGIRLGIAAIEDETREAWGAWHAIRRTIGNGSADPGELRGELLQVAAVCMRIVRTIDLSLPLPGFECPKCGTELYSNELCPNDGSAPQPSDPAEMTDPGPGHD